MSFIDDIFHRGFSGDRKGDLAAQNISLYPTSPYTISYEECVPEGKREPIIP